MKNLIALLLITTTCFAQEPEFFEVPISVQGNNNLSATLLIQLLPDQTEITNPFIVAEGFDAGSITDPETQYGDTDIISFKEEVDDGGNMLNNLIDPTDIDRDYDIIYVNWDNGMADMRLKVRSRRYAV